MKYSEFEAAFERFSIMTTEGGIKDAIALQFIERAYGEEIRDKIERKIKEVEEVNFGV